MRKLSGREDHAETTPLEFGSPVEGSDGRLGRLTDIVVNRDERRLAHLIVEDPEGKARLVPAERLVHEGAADGVVLLSCSRAELAACESIRSFSYVGFGTEPQSQRTGTEIGVEDVVAIPTFGALSFGDYAGDLGGAYGVTYDSIPAGSAELRRDSIVVSESQEMIGTVDGLLVDGLRLTHVLLHHAHRGEKAAIPIPIDSIVAIDTDCVTVARSADSTA